MPDFDWKNIDTVLLDMDGTLLDLHFDNHFWHEHLPLHWSQSRGVTLDEAKQKLGPWIKSHEGTLNWYCLDFWSEELGINIMEIKHEIKGLIRIRHDTEVFLEFLERENKQIVMVTNAHPDLIRMKFDETGIDRFFHHVFSSHEFGIPKEELLFWHQLHEHMPYEKQRSILFDDNLRVLHTAKDYGIAHLISIVQPDSKRPPREITEFPAIDRFEEVMPEA